MADLAQGGKVAKRSFFIQILVGLSELFMGIFTLSIALIADGIQSFADAGVSLIVWIGLKISRKAPDKQFQFGYHRVETLSSIVAALFMATIGAITLIQSYRELLNPTPVANSEVALVVALAAATVSSLLLIYKRRAARKYGSLALKTDASNSIKDVLTSVIAFVGIALSSFFGIIQTDAIAGIIISLFVFTMVYPIIKEASLVLVDSFNSPEIVDAIDEIAKSLPQVKQVHSIRMRKMGSYLIGDMHIVLRGNMTVEEAWAVASRIEAQIQKEYPDILEMSVILEPYK
ncbi:MAG: cation diffusion facilitator family transporter [Candidatus Bathyarchaeota archaeon]|nr:cation diffusion facilitator family transporter [Candidatus Bathyarchaeota archaeon]